MRLTSGHGYRERGAVAVEMAIVLPLLLLVIGGIIDFGRFFLAEVQLANAAREGARAAIVSELDVTARVEAAAPVINGLTVTFTPCAGSGTNATVTAAGDFDWILLEPALSFFGGGATTLPATTATAVMRCEA